MDTCFSNSTNSFRSQGFTQFWVLRKNTVELKNSKFNSIPNDYQYKTSRPAEKQQEAQGKVVIQRPPSTFRLWPMRPKEFHLGSRPLRHSEEFLRIRPLQSEAPQSTRPWGNLPPLRACKQDEEDNRLQTNRTMTFPNLE